MTPCPECEAAPLNRSVGLLPTCHECDWTGWSRDTEATINLPYDFSAEDPINPSPAPSPSPSPRGEEGQGT